MVKRFYKYYILLCGFLNYGILGIWHTKMGIKKCSPKTDKCEIKDQKFTCLCLPFQALQPFKYYLLLPMSSGFNGSLSSKISEKIISGSTATSHIFYLTRWLEFTLSLFFCVLSYLFHMPVCFLITTNFRYNQHSHSANEKMENH